jgi:glycyl-tRNA synthetase beta subunit
VRITRDLEEVNAVDSKSFIEKAEIELGKEIERALEEEIPSGDLGRFFEVFVPIVPAITAFFDNVLVMDEDDAVRKNRLGLLQSVVSLAEGILDFSRLEGF